MRRIATAAAAVVLAFAPPMLISSDAAAHARTHTVRPGETLSGIAVHYDVSVVRLAVFNSIADPNLVVAGGVLEIPEPAPATGELALAEPVVTGGYTVRDGDSLWAIAAAHWISQQALLDANGLSQAAVIHPGDVLSIPGAAIARPRAADRSSVHESIVYWSNYYGLDPVLVLALAWHESGWQQDVVSVAGAVGVMQLMPTASEYISGLLIGDPSLDPYVMDDNVRMGTRYLATLTSNLGGDADLGLAAYYQGERAVRVYGLYGETRLYIANVWANYGNVAR